MSHPAHISPFAKIRRPNWTTALIAILSLYVSTGIGGGKKPVMQNDPISEPKAILDVQKQTSCQHSCETLLNACRLKEESFDDGCLAEKTSCDAECASFVGQVDPVFVDPSVSFPAYTCSNKELVPAAGDATYIILTRPMFAEVLEPFVEAKIRAGERVRVVFVDALLCGEKGVDVPGKIRSFLRRSYEVRSVKKGTPAVLVVGSPRRAATTLNEVYAELGHQLVEPWEVPIRYIRQNGPASPTDQYYASVASAWTPDVLQQREGDPMIYDFSFDYQFVVGRVPARSLLDVQNWIEKTLAWRTPTQFTESRFVTNSCVQHSDASNADWESRSTHAIVQHLCLTDRGGDIADYANQEFPDLITSYGHGSHEGITSWPHTAGFSLTNDSPGFLKPPILFVHGCQVGGVDYPTPSLTEGMMGRIDGVTAVIATSRSHIDNRFPFVDAVFHEGVLTLGEALFSTKKTMAKRMQDQRVIDQLYMYNLYGDPRLSLVSPSYTSSVTPANKVLYTDPTVFSEQVNLPVTVSSYSAEEAEAVLMLNRATHPFVVPAEGSTRVILEMPTADARYENAEYLMSMSYRRYASRSFILGMNQGDSCQTHRRSCIASAPQVAPLIDISCAQQRPLFAYDDVARRSVEYGYLFPFRVHGAASSVATRGPFTVTARVIRGRYYPTGTSGRDIENPVNGEMVARATHALLTPSQSYALEAVAAGAGAREESYTGERIGYTYFDTQHFLEVHDRNNTLVSFCRYGL